VRKRRRLTEVVVFFVLEEKLMPHTPTNSFANRVLSEDEKDEKEKKPGFFGRVARGWKNVEGAAVGQEPPGTWTDNPLAHLTYAAYKHKKGEGSSAAGNQPEKPKASGVRGLLGKSREEPVRGLARKTQRGIRRETQRERQRRETIHRVRVTPRQRPPRVKQDQQNQPQRPGQQERDPSQTQQITVRPRTPIRVRPKPQDSPPEPR
jgi:hypothetical protein